MKKLIFRSALALSLLVALNTPLLAGNVTLTTGTDAPATLTSGQYPQQPAMFKITNGNSTVYLYGSVHRIVEGVKWRTNEFNRAIAHSDRIWFESTMREMLNPTLVLDQLMALKNKDGTRIEDLLSREEMARLTKVAQALSIDIDEYGDLHPWVISDILQGGQYRTDVKKDPKKEITDGNGVEATIQAMRLGKPILPVENTRKHVMVFSQLSPADEKALLMDTISQIDHSLQDEVTEIMKAWSKGDLDAIYKQDDRMRRETPGLYHAMVTERNQIMADKVMKMLKGSGTDFVAVGVAHVAGPNGIISILEKAGYKAERIYDTEPPIASNPESNALFPHYRITPLIPTRLTVSLIRGKTPDEVILHLERGAVIHGCAEVTPIKTKATKSDDTIDVSVYGYFINIHPYPDLEGCGPANKVIRGDVPLDVADLKKNGTSIVKLQTSIAYDYYTLTYDNGTLTLSPKGGQAAMTFIPDMKNLALTGL